MSRTSPQSPTVLVATALVLLAAAPGCAAREAPTTLPPASGPAGPGMAATAPGVDSTAPAPPPGAARADFVSTSNSMQWKVSVDRQPICVTPCTLWLTPGQWVTLRTKERRPIRKELGAIGGQPVRVVAKPLSTGAYATGVTFTTLGGAALVTGITLSSVGCFSDRDGLCTAGKITGVSGAVVTAGAIWLMLRALPRVRFEALGGRGLTLYPTGTGAGAIAEF